MKFLFNCIIYIVVSLSRWILFRYFTVLMKVDGVYAYYAKPSFPYLVGCEGPGIYSAGEYSTPEEYLPSIIGVQYKACASGSYASDNGCIACPAGKFSSRANVISSTSPARMDTSCNMVCMSGFFVPVGGKKFSLFFKNKIFA
jgi:hypothetical protein